MDSGRKGPFMTLIDEYLHALTETKYTTDPDTYRTLVHDVRQMWDIWNRTEFGGKLQQVAVWPTDDTLCIGVDGERDTKICGCYIDSLRLIMLDTTANILDARSGLGGTLYHHLAETLLHEMIHQWCHERGIVETEKDGTHNLAFRDESRKHGLIAHIGTAGWNCTHVRKGHWKPFYDLAPRDLAHRMRTSRVPCEDM